MAKNREQFWSDDDRRRAPRRPRYAEYDEDDDRIPARRRRPSGGGMHLGVILGIVGGVLALLIGAGVIIWVVVAQGGGAGAGGLTGDPAIDAALADLKEANPHKRRAAADRLARMQPIEEHRAVVAGKLNELEPDPDVFTRRAIVGALGLWATPQEVPTLIKYLGDGDVFTRHEALKYLGKFRDERAVVPVVRCLQDVHCRGPAEKALREMGPVVEKELLVLVARKEEDVFARQAAVKILGEVGTQQSLTTLEAVVAENNIFLTNDARAAISAIRSRGKS
jgi:HEAT repeat protein